MKHSGACATLGDSDAATSLFTNSRPKHIHLHQPNIQFYQAEPRAKEIGRPDPGPRILNHVEMQALRFKIDAHRIVYLSTRKEEVEEVKSKAFTPSCFTSLGWALL